jgi:prepilin-type processing-associated H-X9-DG protein
MAGRMYLDDNDGYFPPTKEWLYTKEELGKYGYWPSPGPNKCQWHDARLQPDGALWPYLKDKDCHMCPTFKALSKLRGQTHPRHDASIPIEPQYSYSMNGYLGRERACAVLKESQIVHPIKTFFFSEENMWTIDGLTDEVLNDNCLCVGAGDGFATYHNTPGGDLNEGSANVLFLDGHVDLVHVGLENVEDGFKISVPNDRWREEFQ